MNFLNRKITTVALAALAVLFARKTLQIHAQRAEVASEVKDMQSRADEVRRNNQFLASSSAYFGSDAYLERQARLKLNYKLPDEKVAFVYKDTSVKKSPEPDFKAQIAQMPNWKKWWYYLLGYSQ